MKPFRVHKLFEMLFKPLNAFDRVVLLVFNIET
ncbi:MAG: hypothetical protein JWO06_2668 [Bacteroidota bacterium]|nr:hypothetical protein [Bacteroidota bacterium]